MAGPDGTRSVGLMAASADTSHPEDQQDPLFYLLEQRPWQSSGPLNEARAVQHGELRYIRDRTGRKACLTLSAGYVSRGGGKAQVPRHWNHNRRRDAALVERIGLDYEDGSSVAGL